jgi:hypothetical protein
MISSDIYLCPLLTGAGYFALVPIYLPYLRQLNLEQCISVCDESLEELATAAPELEVINYYGDHVRAGKIELSSTAIEVLKRDMLIGRAQMMKAIDKKWLDHLFNYKWTDI